MEIRSFAFTENHNEINIKSGDFNALEKFVRMCLYRGYDFEVTHERTSSLCVAVIVEVVDIDDADADEYSDYEEIEEDDGDYDYEEPDDLELGFNPYMGCYDYDC